jgi:hypothetical protein
MIDRCDWIRTSDPLPKLLVREVSIGSRSQRNEPAQKNGRLVVVKTSKAHSGLPIRGISEGFASENQNDTRKCHLRRFGAKNS